MDKGSSTDEDVFQLRAPKKGPLRRTLFSLVRRPLEKILAVKRINDLYSTASRAGAGEDICEKVLDALNVTYEISEQDLERIPCNGPLVVIANHPYGGVDGLVLASLLRSLRPDVKLMANYILGLIPEMRDMSIFVDPFGKKSSARINIGPMKEAIKWLKDGGVLAMFPSGEASHISWRKPVVTDPAWSRTVARIIGATASPVLPVYFEGFNSMLFQMLGLVHPRLRTILLPREVLNKADRTINVRVGNVIPAKKLAALGGDARVMSYLRLKTYMLRRRAGKKTGRALPPPGDEAVTAAPIVAQEAPELIRAEVEALPRELVLAETKAYLVFAARAEQIPHVLREIGRLREITFREVGEGTGKEIDLDRFDSYYVHLFLWHKQERELVGAYRLGKSDEILREHGKKGFYTSTLFKYGKKLLQRIGPALELGRSFVRPEYQKQHAPLMLLWKGIGAFVVRNPRYKVLFGPVSISNEYNSTSRRLIVSFLRQNKYVPKLARLVKPQSPLRRRRLHGLDRKALRTLGSDVDGISSLVSDIEADRKGLPILLRHYLRLDGKMLGFNVDAEFGDVVDGLVIVDLTETDRRILERYLGKDETEGFLTYHGGGSGATQAAS